MTETAHMRTECHECGKPIHTLGFRCDKCERAMRQRIARTQSDVCRLCGQYTIGRIDPAGRCDNCQEQDRKPQGEQVRLFEPAPVQMPGQTWIGDPQ